MIYARPRREPVKSFPEIVDRRGEMELAPFAILGANCLADPPQVPALRLACRLVYVHGAARRAWYGDFYATTLDHASRQLQERFTGGAVRSVEILDVEKLQPMKGVEKCERGCSSSS